jgi:RHS repeat-associated protein
MFYYTYADHLGNVVLLSYTGGTPFYSSLARCDPFGNYRATPATTTNPTITNHGFTGHRHNNTGSNPTQNVELIDMNARYYPPEVGRFISPDTIVPNLSNPQSFNRYSYSFNNPVNYTDPSGHDPLDEAWEEAFLAEHSRAPEWYDRLIRLFSIAFPEEWEWSAFYDSNGNLTPDFEAIMMNPPSSRSWANMEGTLTRLSEYYNWNESEIFARDIGTLFAGLPYRSSHGTNFAVTGCVLGPICNNPADLPAHVWAYLQPAGMPERLRGGDGDAIVHHWGWGVAIGSYMGSGAIGINMAREAYQAIAADHILGNPDLRGDIFLGNRGAFFGDALRVFGPRATPLLYRYFVAEW